MDRRNPDHLLDILGLIALDFDPAPCEIEGASLCHHGLSPLEPEIAAYCPIGAAFDFLLANHRTPDTDVPGPATLELVQNRGIRK